MRNPPPLNKRTSGLQWYSTAVWEKFRSIKTIVLTCENILNMSHLFLRTYTNRQWVGQELRHVARGVGGINNDLKCFARFFLLLLRFLFSTLVLGYHIIIRKVPPVSSQRQQTSEIPSVRRASGFSAARFAVAANCSLVSPLSTWIYVFIYTKRLDRTSRGEPTVSIPLELRRIFYFFLFFVIKKKKLLCLRTGSSWSLCSLSMDRVYDLWLPLDPFFFFFWKFVNKDKRVLNRIFPIYLPNQPKQIQ